MQIGLKLVGLRNNYLSECVTHGVDICVKWLGKRLHHLGSETESQASQSPRRFGDFLMCQKYPSFQKYLPNCKMFLQGPIPKKEKVEESSRVKYKTVLCKKYWTVGHCELGPRCVYIHQV